MKEEDLAKIIVDDIVEMCEGNTAGTIVNREGIEKIVDKCMNYDLSPKITKDMLDEWIEDASTEEGYLVTASTILSSLNFILH